MEKKGKGLSYGRKPVRRRKKLPQNPFLKAGLFLAEKAGLDRPGKKNGELCRELVSLASGNPQAVKLFYGKKIADTLLALTVLAVVSLVVFLTVDRSQAVIDQNQLQRPAHGMGDREEELTVQLEGETETELLSITVQEQKFTEQQVSQYLENAKGYLEQNIKGENPSLDEVREKLNFPTSLEEGAVTVSWLTFPYGMIGDDGTITGEPEKTGSLIELQATLSCQGVELVYETAVCVYPPVLTEKEQLWQAVREKVEAADEASAHQSTFPLPDQIEGRRIIWGWQSRKLFPLFFALTWIVPFCFYIRQNQKVHEKAKKREFQMSMDYPELMWKLTMLLGAGLTIRGAFIRIASEYQKENRDGIRYVYEEMVCACHEMKSGISEGTAYENFGRRCGLPRYIKLGSLLSQNLKKGSKGLAALLEKEAASSMEERKNLARKLGEQAGNRMLFPMMLMFGIVLIILIVPAFLSF